MSSREVEREGSNFCESRGNTSGIGHVSGHDHLTELVTAEVAPGSPRKPGTYPPRTPAPRKAPSPTTRPTAPRAASSAAPAGSHPRQHVFGEQLTPGTGRLSPAGCRPRPCSPAGSGPEQPAGTRGTHSGPGQHVDRGRASTWIQPGPAWSRGLMGEAGIPRAGPASPGRARRAVREHGDGAVRPPRGPRSGAAPPPLPPAPPRPAPPAPCCPLPARSAPGARGPPGRSRRGAGAGG